MRQNVAVLYSEATRLAYIAEARECDALYAFTGADGEPRHWLQGQYAYLAPNAATALLDRYNVKHDTISEAEAAAGALDAYRALVVPNGAALPEATIAAIQGWLADDSGNGAARRLIATGRTNLPPDLLGLAECTPIAPDGYTGWRFVDGTFADRETWEEFSLTGYRGYAAARATAAPGVRALAELWEFTGDTTSAAAATRRRLGAAVVATGRTLYVANQALEYVGGALQAQVDVDGLRGWYHPTHYLDALGYLLRALLRDLGLGDLFATQLRSFGTYDGALVLRHDADTGHDEALDLAMPEWEIANQVPATYVVLDPAVSGEHTTPLASRTWVAAARRSNLLEVGLHNDGYAGAPPTYVAGRAMYEHFRDGDRALGITSSTAGRHYGFHRHPETLDAMEYLYDRAPALLGLCTFSVLQVIEYGVEDPARTWLGRPITYSTRFRAGAWTSGAVSGWWFPFHVVIATAEYRRTLRGWDSTKESDCDFARADELLAGRTSADPRVPARLPNGVYTVQYHPQHATDPALNDGRGSLPWVRYLGARAERRNLWLANKRMVYARLNDYQDLRFRAEPDGEVVVANPTNRPIAGLMVRLPGPVGAVLAGDDACAHLVPLADEDGGVACTLPPLAPGAEVRLRTVAEQPDFPVISQPNSKTLEIVAALYRPARGELAVTARAIARSALAVERLAPGRWYDVALAGPGVAPARLRAGADGRLVISLEAPREMVVTLELIVREAP
ncbi:MAG TPA: hypothetical protein VFW96_07900 [Thermomicrobiales bacterium]|nr:hypothetical protein [Thermomicrobiales bacterium]